MLEPRSSATLISLSLSVLLLLYLTSVSGYGRMVGGRSEVPDVKTNKEVQELGRFSVEEFNRQQQQGGGHSNGVELVFSEVVEAQRQLVSGLKYYMKIEATKNGEKKMFDSEVFVKSWVPNSKQLINFAPTVA